MELHAGHHTIAHFAGMSFNMDTLYMTWLVMAGWLRVNAPWCHEGHKM